MKACELADIVNEKFGEVSFAAIDLDTDVNYPKGERWVHMQMLLLLHRVIQGHPACYLLLPVKVQEGSHFHQLTASWLRCPPASFR